MSLDWLDQPTQVTPCEQRYTTVSLEDMIIAGVPPLDDPTETYHEASRLYPGIVDPFVNGARLLEESGQLRASAARSVKRHRGVPTITLPPASRTDATLASALSERRSDRRYGPGSISMADLATLLGASYGVTGALGDGSQAIRTAPSGGALYPLELYVAAERVDTLDAALYHYDPLRHQLEQLRLIDFAGQLQGVTPYPEVVCASAAVVVITTMFWRSRFKYGARAYRFALIEAGHVAQNFLLTATALGLASVPLGGFYDREVDALVDADGLNEASLYLLPVGPKP